MLDTHGRKYLNPAIEATASWFLKRGFTPNGITLLAFAIGLGAPVLLIMGLPVMAVVALWLSGYLDAVDGAAARQSGKTSAWGTLMDILFDRVVECGVILSVVWVNPNTSFAANVLLCMIILSMTLFLTTGALTEKKGMKSFYYQAGLAERTEGFIFLTLMILWVKQAAILACIFAVIIAITVVQRGLEAHRIFKEIK